MEPRRKESDARKFQSQEEIDIYGNAELVSKNEYLVWRNTLM